MKLFLLSLVGVLAMGATYKTLSLDDVESIHRTTDGRFEVHCKDQTREVVSEQDILDNNVCPHQAPPVSYKKVDILWVVDNSPSMQTSQDQVAKHIDIFISKLLKTKLDFQIAVTGTDAWIDGFVGKQNCSVFRDGPVYAAWDGSRYTYCGDHGIHKNIRVINNSTPDLVNVFKNNIQQGTKGAGDERSFQSIAAALENPLNLGFFRDSSYLAVIILTDEDDTSHSGHSSLPHGAPELHAPSKYYNYLDNLTGSKPISKPFSVSSIAIKDPACRDLLNSDGYMGRVMAHRVNSLVDKSFGLKLSICDPANKNLDGLVDHIINNVNKK